MAALAVSCTMLSPLGHVRVNEDTPRVLEGPQDQPGFENAYQNFIYMVLSKLVLNYRNLGGLGVAYSPSVLRVASSILGSGRDFCSFFTC